MSIAANESTVPILACSSVGIMVEFYESMGFRVTYRQERPYAYLSVQWSGFELHFRKPPRGSDTDNEDVGAAIVFVDDVAAYHVETLDRLRTALGSTPRTGLPRITRFRKGATRFTLYDPSGNAVIFVARAEPRKLDYGGAPGLVGLAKAMDQARIYREFKNDDGAALRYLTSAMRRHGATATATERETALQTMAELARDLGDDVRADALEVELARVDPSVLPTDDVERGPTRRS